MTPIQKEWAEYFLELHKYTKALADVNYKHRNEQPFFFIMFSIWEHIGIN